MRVCFSFPVFFFLLHAHGGLGRPFFFFPLVSHSPHIFNRVSGRIFFRSTGAATLCHGWTQRWICSFVASSILSRVLAWDWNWHLDTRPCNKGPVPAFPLFKIRAQTTRKDVYWQLVSYLPLFSCSQCCACWFFLTPKMTLPAFRQGFAHPSFFFFFLYALRTMCLRCSDLSLSLFCLDSETVPSRKSMYRTTSFLSYHSLFLHHFP